MLLLRRTILAGLAAMPCLSNQQSCAGDIEIQHQPHLLSEESAHGYRALLQNHPPSGVLILAGVCDLSLERCEELRRRMNSGQWVILESGVCFSPEAVAQRQSEVLQQAFGLQVQPPVLSADPYIQYRRLKPILVRSFQAFTPVVCDARQAIAFSSGRVVATRKPVGMGGLIYLGSMLGPGLFSEEREAQLAGRALIQWTT